MGIGIRASPSPDCNVDVNRRGFHRCSECRRLGSTRRDCEARHEQHQGERGRINSKATCGTPNDSIETAYREAGGTAFGIEDAGGRVHLFSERFECQKCKLTYEAPQPRLFSFNNPFGACPTCHGFGNIIELDLDLVVPDTSKSIQQGAIEPWTKTHYRAQLAELKRAAKTAGIRIDVPWRDLTDSERELVVDGDGKDYDGIRGFFRWLERKKYKVHVRVFLSRYRGYLMCPDCGGARLRREARDVRVGGRTIDQVSSDTVREAQQFLQSLQVSDKERAIATKG